MYDFLLVRHCNYSSILPFASYLTLNNTVTLQSGLEVTQVIEIGAIQKLDCGFYSPSIVTMAVSLSVCETFSVKEWCDLENRSGFVQGHWKWHYLIDCIRVPIHLP